MRPIYSNELMHYGVLGMKWGVRRYQNADGSLTAAGRAHYGIIDRRRYEFQDKITSNQKTLNKSLDEKETIVTKNKKIRMEQLAANTGLNRLLQAKSEKIVREALNNKNFNLYDTSGKRVGEFEMYQESESSLNGVWLGINKDQRGNHYATSVMETFIDYGKRHGYDQLTLEVPGDSPDARHIYEKLGFEVVSTISDEDDVWGGLTAMKLDLKKSH